MSRFHLHMSNSIGSTQDEEGLELGSLEEAESKAIDGIRSVLCEEIREGRFDLRGRINIAATSGEVLRTILFRDAVQCYFDEDAA